jgi:hypothetical protein
MTGINRYEGKDKRRERIRNHIVRDLRTSKYKQRVIPDKRKNRMEDDDDD